MIIAHKNFPSIGHIRVKPLDGRHRLTIYPPTFPGALMGWEPASHVEIIVDDGELRRLENMAPHLFLGAQWHRRARHA